MMSNISSSVDYLSVEVCSRPLCQALSGYESGPFSHERDRMEDAEILASPRDRSSDDDDEDLDDEEWDDEDYADEDEFGDDDEFDYEDDDEEEYWDDDDIDLDDDDDF